MQACSSFTTFGMEIVTTTTIKSAYNWYMEFKS